MPESDPTPPAPNEPGRADDRGEDAPHPGHDDAVPGGMSRNRFLNLILGTGAGGFAAAVIYPVGRYIMPPEAPESSASSVVLQLGPDDIPPNTGQVFKFGNKPAIIVRTPTGELRAFSAVCTHLECTVQYRTDLSHIWCACHNGHFDLSGRNIAGPPPSPLAQYDVNVRGDAIVVSRRA